MHVNQVIHDSITPDIRERLVREYLRTPAKRKVLAMSLVRPANSLKEKLEGQLTLEKRREFEKLARDLVRVGERLLGRMAIHGEDNHVYFIGIESTQRTVAADLRELLQAIQNSKKIKD